MFSGNHRRHGATALLGAAVLTVLTVPGPAPAASAVQQSRPAVAAGRPAVRVPARRPVPVRDPAPADAVRAALAGTGPNRTSAAGGDGGASDASAVDLTVSPTQVLRTGLAGGRRLGINTNYWWDDQRNRPASARSLPSALGGLGARYWRYPGGEKGDGMLLATPAVTSATGTGTDAGSAGANAATVGPQPMLARVSDQDWPAADPTYWQPPGDPAGHWAHPMLDFDTFMAQCRAAGCIPVIVVAYDGIYKPAFSGGSSLTREEALRNAYSWVWYANHVKNYGITYWEIGNETWNPGYMGGDPGPTREAEDFVEFCSTMHDADPGIRCGISTQGVSEWDTLLSVAGPSIGFLSVHSYESFVFGSYQDYAGADLDPLARVRDAADALAAHPELGRIPIAVTETGGVTFGVRGSWTQADLGHSLMTFDTLAQLARDDRVDFTLAWCTRWVEQNLVAPGADYPGREYDMLEADNSPTPQGLAMQLFTSTLPDTMVASTSSATVRSFAGRDPDTGRLVVWLVNKAERQQAVRVRLAGSGTLSGTRQVLGGQGWWDKAPRISPRSTVTAPGGQLRLTLDPVSVTVVQLG